MSRLDPEFYPEELRRKLDPSVKANPAGALRVSPPAAVQSASGGRSEIRAAERVVPAIVAAGVTARTAGAVQNDHFTPLHDSAVHPQHRATLAKYRRLATAWGVPAETSVCYLVRDVLTLEKPTRGCYVFWIPRLVPGSTSKTKDEQLQLLAELRSRVELPAHHLASLGSGDLLISLILAHLKATTEHVPLGGYWTRTDIRYAGGSGLYLYWYEGGYEARLCCDYWHLDGGRYGNAGVFALGLEALGS